jgi:uncharacterized protein
VALAVRMTAPIFVAVHVIDEAGIPTDDSEDLASVEQSEPEVETQSAETTPKSQLEQLEDDLQTAIAEEDYELAARLRDDISRLKGEKN